MVSTSVGSMSQPPADRRLPTPDAEALELAPTNPGLKTRTVKTERVIPRRNFKITFFRFFCSSTYSFTFLRRKDSFVIRQPCRRSWRARLITAAPIRTQTAIFRPVGGRLFDIDVF